jgi:hypothetical protein
MDSALPLAIPGGPGTNTSQIEDAAGDGDAQDRFEFQMCFHCTIN